MPYTKDQLKAYWQANKAILNQKRREKRRLAKFGLATEEVSQRQEKVSHKSQMANPILAQLIQEWQTRTNYNCASTCTHSYCSNCWYFVQNQLVNYKGII